VGPERRFRVNQVIPFLKTLKNSYFFPIQQKAIHGDADFIGVSSGLFLALELKALKGRLAPLQAWKGSEIRRCGGLYIVCSENNWDDTKSLLTKLDKGERP
jgi:hypothetical protein